MLPAAQQWGVEILILLLFLLAEILTGQIVVCIGKLLSILGFHWQGTGDSKRESGRQASWGRGKQSEVSFACFQERHLGQRLNIILVAEGALDFEGKPITAERVKNVSDCPLLLYLVCFSIHREQDDTLHWTAHLHWTADASLNSSPFVDQCDFHSSVCTLCFSLHVLNYMWLESSKQFTFHAIKKEKEKKSCFPIWKTQNLNNEVYKMLSVSNEKGIIHTKTNGQRSFTYPAATVLNNLPLV